MYDGATGVSAAQDIAEPFFGWEGRGRVQGQGDFQLGHVPGLDLKYFAKRTARVKGRGEAVGLPAKFPAKHIPEILGSGQVFKPDVADFGKTQRAVGRQHVEKGVHQAQGQRGIFHLIDHQTGADGDYHARQQIAV